MARRGVPRVEGAANRPGLVARWRAAYLDGTASAECDRIIASEPVPDRLMLALAHLIANTLDPLSELPPGQPNTPPPDFSRSRGPLTGAQAEALFLMAAGKTAPCAAAMLGSSNDVVRERLRHARRHLGARNTRHAVAIAIRAGLI